MGLYEDITYAREILGVPEKATLNFIKKRYKELLVIWHPDKCKSDKEVCEEKTREIIRAGRVLLEYCNKYEINFSKEEVEKHISPDEMWLKKFGESFRGGGE
ncbi:MAG: J domain-containing protein [Brevinematia bacterium]